MMGATPIPAAPATDASGAAPREAPRPRHPVFDLLSRYAAVFRAAWSHRAELAGPKRMADEIHAEGALGKWPQKPKGEWAGNRLCIRSQRLTP